MKTSIQSWCFRTWREHEKLIEATRACGLGWIELGGAFLDLNQVQDPMSVVSQYRDNGVDVSGYGVQGFDGDMEAARTVFSFAKDVGISSIAANFPQGSALESAKQVEPLCHEFGVNVAIHNHGRKHHLGPPFVLEDLFKKTDPCIGLCLDTAWMLDSGYDPVEIAKQFRDRLYGVHMKDFIFDRAGTPEDTVVGKGNLRLNDLLLFLKETGYDEFLTIEYEGDVDDPVPACKRCAAEIEAVLSKL